MKLRVHYLIVVLVVCCNHCFAQQTNNERPLIEQVLDKNGDGKVTKAELEQSVGAYDLVVGAQGNPVQLAANALLGISKPVENIPYDLYLEFLEKTDWVDADKLFKQLDENGDGKINLLSEIYHHPGMRNVQILCRRADKNKDGLIEKDELKKALNEKGAFNKFVETAIPLCIGDMLVKEGVRYQVIGTTPGYFETEYIDGEHFKFAGGRNIHRDFRKPENFFEAVVGSEIANRFNLKLGDKINPQHGWGPGSFTHENSFTVVGILEPTRTVNDFRAFVNIEGFYKMENHQFFEERLEDEENDDLLNDGFENDERILIQDEKIASSPERIKKNDGPISLPEREVTVILVKTVRDEFGMSAIVLKNSLPEIHHAQAVRSSAFIFGLQVDADLEQFLKLQFRLINEKNR